MNLEANVLVLQAVFRPTLAARHDEGAGASATVGMEQEIECKLNPLAFVVEHTAVGRSQGPHQIDEIIFHENMLHSTDTLWDVELLGQFFEDVLPENQSGSI